MLRKVYFVPVLLLLASYAVGQATKQKITFSSINQVGLLTGEAGEHFTAQTINGIKKGKWFTGIGAGFDLYGARTFPLFLDLRRDLGNKINTTFAYMSAGINFLSLSSADKIQTTDHSSSPGLYYDLGVGWKLMLKNNRGLLLSAGYTFKQVKEKYQVLWGAPTAQLQSESYDHYNYQYRRVVIKLGLQL